MPLQPRASLPPAHVTHGGPDSLELEQLDLRPEDLLDFSVSTNPLGPSPGALAAALVARLDRYPDRHALALRRTLARDLGLEVEQLLVGNGSAELIWLLAAAFIRSGDPVLVLEPTFGEYRQAASLFGAELFEWRASGADDFHIDSASVAAQIAHLRPRLTFLCNPNNPTGAWLTRSDLERLLAALPDGLLVLDEAYLDLAGRDSPAAPLLGADNLLLLRSMTKDFGLPGLRLGYAVSNAAIIATLSTTQPPWSVNAAAQAAGLAALADEAHVEAGRRAAAAARAFLVPRLEALGYRCLPSVANFWLVEVGDAAAFRQRMLRHGILVRDCSSFGLPAYVRLAARPLPECQRLLEALESLT